MNAKITLIPVGAVGPQITRPLAVPGMSRLPEDVAGWSGHLLSTEAMGQTREVNIEGGWAAKRMALIVDVSEEQYGRTITTSAYGYTGELFHKDLSIIDPEVRVTFNRLVTTVTGKWSTVEGVHTATHVVNDLHLLTKPQGEAFTLRPEDVLGRIEVERVTSNTISNTPYLDMRASFGSIIAGVPVVLEHPATYLNTLGDALKAAHGDNILGGLDDSDQVFSDARMRLCTSVNASNDFIKALLEQTNWRHEGTVSYGELLTLFGPDVTTVDLVKANALQVEHPTSDAPEVTGDLESATGAIAMLITRAVSGIMGRQGVESVYLESHTVDGGAIFSEKETFADGPQVDWEMDGDVEELPGFVDEVNLAIRGIAKANGLVSLTMSIDISLATIATVYLSVNDEETQKFVFPMYASALTSNLITDSIRELDDLARFTEMFYTELTTVRMKPIELE